MSGHSVTRGRFWSRWGPSIVGTTVSVVAIGLSAVWVVDRVEGALREAGGSSARPVSQPAAGGVAATGRVEANRTWADAKRFTPELDGWVRRVAEQQGLDPAKMPTAGDMYAEMDDRGVILAPAGVKEELERYAPDLARQAGDDHLRAVLALNVVAMARAARDVEPTGRGGSDSIAQLDQLLSGRLSTRAAEAGVDESTVLPAADVRQAAVATGRVDSPESQALLHAYAEAFDQLNAGSR